MGFKEDLLKVLNHQGKASPGVYMAGLHSTGTGPTVGPDIEKGSAGGGYDGFGVRWVTPASGGGAAIPAPGEYLLDDVTKWKEVVKFPDVDAYNWEDWATRELDGCNRSRQLVDFGCGNGPFERLAALMGFEEALISMAMEPEATFDLLTAITDYKIKVAEKVKKYYNADLFTSYDDIATERGLFMSPEAYRQLIKPQHKRLCDAVHNLGMKPINHCCGLAQDVVADMIDCGWTGWTSVQPTNDIPAILQKYGDKIVIIGGYDSNGPSGWPDATEEVMRAEVRRCFSEYGKYDSYLFFGFKIVNSLDPKAMMKEMGILADEVIKLSIKNPALKAIVRSQIKKITS